MTQTVVCMKWGSRYGPEYVNALANMVARNTRRETRLVCFTDDPGGIEGGVETRALPEIQLPEHLRWMPWRKISLWKPELGGIEGDILFMDLDVIVTGNIDDLFDFEPGKFCGIKNWTQAKDGVVNTSVFRFRVGSAPHLFERLERDATAIRARYRNEQIYVTNELGADIRFWPESWCLSFKHQLIPPWPLNLIRPPTLPADARVVAFTGKPDPDEALRGSWPAPWYKKFYKHVRPAPWIAEHWR